jgi:hypothetical protein
MMMWFFGSWSRENGTYQALMLRPHRDPFAFNASAVPSHLLVPSISVHATCVWVMVNMIGFSLSTNNFLACLAERID